MMAMRVRVPAVSMKHPTRGSRARTASSNAEAAATRTGIPVGFPLLSIDPGLGGTGWAYWGDRSAPAVVGIVRDTARDDLLSVRCHELCDKLWTAIPSRRFRSIVIELPQHMASAAGIAAQAGAVYKLAFLVGAMSLFFTISTYGTVYVVNPADWKGQLPKNIVQQRIQARLGMRVCQRLNIRSHAWDAVGIGLWAVGRL